VIKPIIQNLSIDENLVVTIGAGVHIKDFLDFCITHTLSGWEWAGGLPSSVGGAIWGNAGAFGGETKDSVIDVQSLRLSDVAIVTRTNVECSFKYRSSIFKTTVTDEIIVSARLQMKSGTLETLKQLIEEKKEYRKNKQPLEYPNCGSIFKNTPVEKIPAATIALFKDKIKSDPQPVLPTAVLTAAAGLKEFRIGGAMVSPKHTNFIVNVGGATAADVKAVMSHVHSVVKEKFGVELEQEVIFVGE
jgi:UDP-N-acetylmuramate dehydrogenase